ncbi:hypothetical protein [Rhodocista pekingensis]|uniref:Uncharacterized protein n=1 Tax=Rhodocista pekingensis TaxID=201185 RepID=A0ABW2KV53_9PROT
MSLLLPVPAAPDPRPAPSAPSRPPQSILALDLGTVLGWALRASDSTIVSGTEAFRQDRWSGGGMRYLRFRRWLREVATMTGGLGLVVYEEVRRHAGTDAAHVYGGFLATLTAWCEDRNVAYEAVPVGTIKRFVTGKGNAGKAAVIAAIRARGFNPADDNEADALALLLWAIQHRAGGVS